MSGLCCLFYTPIQFIVSSNLNQIKQFCNVQFIYYQFSFCFLLFINFHLSFINYFFACPTLPTVDAHIK